MGFINRSAALLAACAILSGAATASMADTLVDNVDGYRVGSKGRVERFTGLVIDDSGKVERLLERRDKRPERPDYRYDAKGLALIPAMLLGQCDLLSLGRRLQTIDLSRTVSLEDALTRIAAHASANPLKPWIIGYGWNSSAWAATQPVSAAELDRIVGDRPALMLDSSAKLGWANTPAIADSSATPSADGLVRGAALSGMIDRLPRLRPVDRDSAFIAAQRHLISRGIVGLTFKGITIEDWQSLRRLGDFAQLNLRVAAYASDIGQMELIGGPGPTPWLYSDRLRLNGLSLDIDNAGSPAGSLLISGTPLRNQMARAAMDNFQVMLTAISPPARAEAQDAIAEVSESFGEQLRWRTDETGQATGADQGCDANPLEFVAGSEKSSLERDDLAGPAEPMSVAQKLKRVSMDRAIAMQAEDRFGSLAPGKRADFLIVSASPFDESANRQIRLLQVWLGGQRLSTD